MAAVRPRGGAAAGPDARRRRGAGRPDRRGGKDGRGMGGTRERGQGDPPDPVLAGGGRPDDGDRGTAGRHRGDRAAAPAVLIPGWVVAALLVLALFASASVTIDAIGTITLLRRQSVQQHR